MEVIAMGGNLNEIFALKDIFDTKYLHRRVIHLLNFFY